MRYLVSQFSIYLKKANYNAIPVWTSILSIGLTRGNLKSPMTNQLLKLVFGVEIEEGEQLNLPSSIVQALGKGKWIITMQPKNLVIQFFLSHF